MTDPPKRGRGRPPKAPEDRVKKITVSLSPELYDEMIAYVRHLNWSALTARAFVNAINREKRKAERGG